ncbi:2TM domain-containing protein [Zeaxanthinibacter sp. PT1]|uniref:2TM domain-containing protein n=1 Tax=Zeaxanthinibacter TaxID=561554 RepID=UPI002349DD28|nr:2TM domain-containing protein [Zeaxanthinibacter sp. PT1]MDC6352257.1 2TM domain-containing protein [Zeaxanthinibacter sp. PT1]
MKTENFDKPYQRANRKVKRIKDFYMSLLAYCIVIPLLAYINWQTTSIIWAVFPAVGWGIGLVFLGMCAFDLHPFLGKNWEERKLREFMNQDNS